MGNSINNALTAEQILKTGRVKKLLPNGIERYSNIPGYDFDFSAPIKDLISSCDSIKNWSPAYVGTGVLSILSLLAGNKFVVTRGDHTQLLNMFILFYGNSAASKSPVFYFLLNYLLEIDKAASRDYKQALKEYKSREKAAKAANQPFEEEPPTLRLYIITGGTMEGIKHAVMQGGVYPIYIFADEILSFLGSGNKYDKGGDFRQTVIEIQEGKGWNIVTKGEGMQGTYSPHVVLAGGYQGAVAKAVIGTNADGLSYRYHIAHNDRDDVMPTGEAIPKSVIDGYTTILDRLISIPYQYAEYTDSANPTHMRLTEAAERIYYAYGEMLTKIINAEKHSYVASLLKKHRGYCLKLAALMQLMYYLSHEAGNTDISERAINAAIELTDYYIATSIKAHEDVFTPTRGTGLFGVKKAIYEALPDDFTTAQGLDIAVSNGMGRRTFFDFLKTDVFENQGRGQYAKK